MFLYILAAERGPPVTNAGLAPLGPWAAFLTWDQPEGINPDDLVSYRLNFTTFTVDVPATDKLMMHMQDYGIEPGMEVVVGITAMYKYKDPSEPLYRKCKSLPACRFITFS